MGEVAGAGRPGDDVTITSLLRRNAAYRRVFVAHVVSQGGDWFAMVPLIVLLDELTGNGALGALLLGAETLVIAALSPVAGTFVDRVDRRRLMIVCQLVAATAVLLLLLVRSESTAWIAVVTYGGLAASKAFVTPSVGASLPHVVDRHELLSANAGIGAVWGVMLALGATLGGLAAAATSPYVCFVIDSACLALSAVLLARIRQGGLGGGTTTGPVRSRRYVRHELADVVRLCRGRRDVVALMLSKPGSHLGNGVIALFPAVAATTLGAGPVGASLLFAARGVGALLGPLVGRQWVRHGGSLRGGLSLAIALYGLGYLAYSITGSLVVAIVFVVLAHVGGSANASLSGYGLQLVVPDEVRGRVLAADNMFAMLAIGASQLGVAAAVLVLDEVAVTRALAVLVLVYATGWWFATRRIDPGAAQQRALRR